MYKSKIIKALLQGDTAALKQSLPVQVVDLYQIEGREQVYRLDGTEVSSEQLKALEASNTFLTVKTYQSVERVR